MSQWLAPIDHDENCSVSIGPPETLGEPESSLPDRTRIPSENASQLERTSFEVTVACSASPLPEKPALPPQLAIEAARHAIGSTDCLSVAGGLELTTAAEMPLAVAEIQAIV